MTIKQIAARSPSAHLGHATDIVHLLVYLREGTALSTVVAYDIDGRLGDRAGLSWGYVAARFKKPACLHETSVRLTDRGSIEFVWLAEKFIQDPVRLSQWTISGKHLRWGESNITYR